MKNEIVNSNYVQDLEDAFELDCSIEDLKESKEAKVCYRTIRKIRRRTNRFRNFINKLGGKNETYLYTKRKSQRIW